MLSVAMFVVLGTLALSAGSEVTPDAVKLDCAVWRLPTGAFLHQVAPPLHPDRSDSSWATKDGTNIAHYPEFDPALVEELSRHSVTTAHCMDFLRFVRREQNQTDEQQLTVSEAVCEVNCSAFVQTPDPAPNTHPNSTNSTDPSPMGRQSLDPITIVIIVASGVLLVVLLLGCAYKYLKKYYNNKMRGNRTRTLSADEEVKFQRDRLDPEIVC